MTALMTLLLATWTMAQTPAVAPAPEGADPEIHKLFLAKCASCHLKDGKGNPKMVKMLKTELAKLDLTDDAAMSDEDLLKIITEGEKKMPGFKAKLKEAEIASLVGYLRLLAPPAPDK